MVVFENEKREVKDKKRKEGEGKKEKKRVTLLSHTQPSSFMFKTEQEITGSANGS